MDSLLMAVSTVLWGHFDVIDDHVIACLRQVLVDNLLSNSNHDSQLARRWKLHNDVIAANVDLDLDIPSRVKDMITIAVDVDIVVVSSFISFFSVQGLNSVVVRILQVSLELPRPTDRLPHAQLQLPYGLTSMFRSR